MATWQFDFHLVPASSLERHHHSMPSTLSIEEYDGVDWWLDVHLRRELEEDIARLLPSAHSWHRQLQTWGTADGDRIDMWLEGERTASVFGRVDVRALSLPFLRRVVDIARRRDLMIATEAGQVLRPSIEELLAAIQRSPSRMFVDDLDAFFRNLNRQSP